MNFFSRLGNRSNLLHSSNSNANKHLIAAYSAKGKNNWDDDAGILKDLSGNGHDLVLHNFDFSNESGYNGYENWIRPAYHYNASNHPFRIDAITYDKDSYILAAKATIEIPKVMVRVDLVEGCDLYYAWYDANKVRRRVLLSSGNIYTLEKSYSTDNTSAEHSEVGFRVQNIRGDVHVIIEQIQEPENKDALVFNGVNNYAANYNFPILNDYTVIIKRRNDNPQKNSCSIGQSEKAGFGAFILETDSNTNVSSTWSYGKKTLVYTIKKDICFQTKTSYNGQPISVGNKVADNLLTIGNSRPKNIHSFLGAIYCVYIFDISLSPKEIELFIRNYIDAKYSLPK